MSENSVGTMGTVYDFNKLAYEKVKGPEQRKREMLANIGMWFSSDPKFKYFMFLCRELSDYTIFNFESFNYSKAKEELEELIHERGELLDIVYNHNNDTYEIWMRTKSDNQIHMYMLFDCNDFIITI